MDENMNQKTLKIETLLYCLIFFLALSVRFIHLGQTPLNDFEAEPAMKALSVSRAESAVIGDQPAYVMLTSALFRVFNATDIWARFWPALAGAAIVLVPYLLRGKLPGRTGLAAALFLAVDPALVAISRTAGGQSLAIVFGLLALSLLMNRKWIAGGICLGIALSSGQAFWFGTLILAVVVLIIRIGSTHHASEESNIKQWGLTAGVAALTAVLVSTGFMFLPNGITGIANGLVSFVKRWDAISLVTIKTSLIVFASTYLPAILLAVFGYLVARKKHPEWAHLLLIWFVAAAVIVIVIPAREVSDWVWAILPLWGLAALGIIVTLPALARSERVVLLAEFVLTFALLLFSVLNLMAYFFNSYGDAVVDRNRLIGAGLPLLLLIIATAFLAWGWSPKSAIQGLGLGIGVLLCAWIFSAGMKSAGSLVQPSGIAWKPQPILVDEKLLVSQVEDLSLWIHGQRHQIDIEVVNYDTPSLRWALRDFSFVTWDLQYSPVETPSVIIAPDYQQIGSTTLYRGQGIAWAQYPSYAKMGFSEWMRWIFYRQAPVDEIRLILYARNDLFKQ